MICVFLRNSRGKSREKVLHGSRKYTQITNEINYLRNIIPSLCFPFFLALIKRELAFKDFGGIL